MRIHALAISILTGAATLAQAQPVYYARSVAGLGTNGDGGPARAARVVLPSRLTADAAGNVYVGEASGRIRKIATDGTISSLAQRQDGTASGDNGPVADAGISSLLGLTVSGNFLYIAQRTPCNIRRVNLTTGIISNFAGTGTCAAGPDGAATATSLNSPGALAADRQGRIYVTENGAVRRIDPSTGQIETFAGDGTAGFTGDNGPALQARVNGPTGLAIDSKGTVYISDTGNCRIRRVFITTGIITTIAGSLTCGAAGDGGSAIQAQLANNGDLTLDEPGSLLYVASSNQIIRRLALDTGIIDRFAGTGLQGPVQENIPSFQADLRIVTGIYLDASGNMLFADNAGNRVGKIGLNGLLTTLAGALTYAGDGGPAQYAFLTQPVDVIPEPGGRFLIAESVNRRIRRLSPPGILTTFAGSGAPGAASGNGASALSATFAPTTIFRDGSGNIYITDSLSNTVRRIATNGAIAQIGPVFNSTLGGVAVDPAERFVYVSLTSQHRIARISLATTQVEVFAGLGAIADSGTAGFSGDGSPAAQAQLSSPQRLFIDPSGNLFVADTGNHRIRRISPSGDRIDTVAGNGLSDFSGDGNLATQASLPRPTAITIDSAGNIIVANDSSVFRVDKITGRMNRIAGRTTRGNSILSVPALQASFNTVGNVSVDERGIIYFAEPLNFRVVALTPSTLSTPTITGIISPGAFGAGTILTPGGWMEIYGERLSSTTREWSAPDFSGTVAPISLAGVSVRIGGYDAFVQLVSPGQINAVVPEGVFPGNVTVEVSNNKGPGNTVTSDPITMIAAARAPYLLAPPAFSRNRKQYVAAVLSDGAFAGPPGLINGANFRAARPGNRIVLYGVGFGPTTPAILAGNIASGITTLPNAKIKIAGNEAILEYAGLATNFVGLYQFNFILPSSPSGDAKLEITVDGQPLTQTLYLAVE